MISILYQDSQISLAQDIASNLENAFSSSADVDLISASTSGHPVDAAWDDVLVLLFDGEPYPARGIEFMTQYLGARGGRAFVLPMAIDPSRRVPPGPSSEYKALEMDASCLGTHGRLVKRVGAMIGLRATQRNNRIFISYRASDGSVFASQLEAKLDGLGYPVWRDEARELNGDTSILPGSPVQMQIDEALAGANLVVLLDTPSSPNSKWIKHEVDTANGLLLPILPICIRQPGDRKQGPRFRSLIDLQRWVNVTLVPLDDFTQPLPNTILDQVVAEIEEYLCVIYQRQCRVPFLVEREFVSRNFSWTTLDPKLRMSQAVKQHSARLATRILSHCSVFDHVHGAALTRFTEFLTKVTRPNHSLYIYDGDLIPEPQLAEIINESPAEDIVILHHQELAALIDSNFTILS